MEQFQIRQAKEPGLRDNLQAMARLSLETGESNPANYATLAMLHRTEGNLGAFVDYTIRGNQGTADEAMKTAYMVCESPASNSLHAAAAKELLTPHIFSGNRGTLVWLQNLSSRFPQLDETDTVSTSFSAAAVETTGEKVSYREPGVPVAMQPQALFAHQLIQNNHLGAYDTLIAMHLDAGNFGIVVDYSERDYKSNPTAEKAMHLASLVLSHPAPNDYHRTVAKTLLAPHVMSGNPDFLRAIADLNQPPLPPQRPNGGSSSASGFKL
jgi:hypothetical protein